MEKNNKKKLLKYIVAFSVPVICIVIHMITAGCYPFGKNTILLGDANAQYYAFFLEMYDRIKGGKTLFFSWNMGLGYDFSSNFFYYLASPFNLIAMLFGKSYMELGMIVTMCVQVGLCGVTMTYFLKHTKENTMGQGAMNEIVCALFGLVYAMCDFMLAYQYNIIWLICLMLVPLVMLGVEKLVKTGDVKLYFISMVLAFVLNFYFSWFVAIMAVVWFVDVKKDTHTFWKRFARFALTSITAAGCAAVVLVPCFFAVYSRTYSGRVDNSVKMTTWGNFANYLQSYFWGNSYDTYGQKLFGLNAYVGVFTVILVLVYLLNRKIDRLSRIKRMVEIVIFSISLNLVAAIYVLHGMTLPHLYSCRFEFILSIILLVCAFESIANYERIGYIRTAVIAVFVLAMVAFVFMKNNNVQSIACYMVTILLLAYMLLLLVFNNKNSVKNKSVIINFVVIGILELASNAVYTNLDNAVISKDKEGGSSHWAQDYLDIDNSNLNRKSSWILSQNNIAYSDASIFSSSTNGSLVNLYDKVGLVYQENTGSYAYRGTTPVTALMLNVKNVLSDTGAYFGGYELEKEYSMKDDEYGIDETYGFYTTPYAMGAGYVCSDAVADWNMTSIIPFEVQNNFVESLTGVNDVFTRVDTSELDGFDSGYSTCIPKRDYTYGLGVMKSDNVYKYINTSLDEADHASVYVGFVVPRDMHLYVYLEDKHQLCTRVYVDGEPLSDDSVYPAPSELLDLGDLKKGQTVYLNAVNISSQLQTGITYIDFYEYHDDKMQQCMDSLSKRKLDIDKVDDTYVHGTFNAEDDGILYTSIPYYRGFTAYVDGKKAEIVKIADGALIGVKISRGKHSVEFRYVTYGFKLGLILSAAGWLIVVLYMVNLRRSRKKKVQAA